MLDDCDDDPTNPFVYTKIERDKQTPVKHESIGICDDCQDPGYIRDDRGIILCFTCAIAASYPAIPAKPKC